MVYSLEKEELVVYSNNTLVERYKMELSKTNRDIVMVKLFEKELEKRLRDEHERDTQHRTLTRRQKNKKVLFDRRRSNRRWADDFRRSRSLIDEIWLR